MTHYAFIPSQQELDVPVWRPLDRALHRWVITHGGSPLLATVAAWTSLADGHGDTALPLDDEDAGRRGMPRLDLAEIESLRAQAMVWSPSAATIAPRPFVLDADGRFYLWRNHQHETAVVAAIQARRQSASTVDVAEADIDALFHGLRSGQVEAQRSAVRGVAGRKLFVLTGGPGTGKTTTVLRMLLMLQRQSVEPLVIQVAAPTGKAAQRLVQSLRQGKQDLLHHPAAPLPVDWRRLLERVPDHEALTLHRLLGYQPYDNSFKRSARDPIAADIVVVDEASMVDLAMLRSLLDAVRPEATLILVGDADQLTSVAAGSVLMDLVAAMQGANAGEGVGDLVRLQHSFRAEAHLVGLNRAINAGDAEAVRAAISGAGTQARHVPIEEPRQLGAQLARWSKLVADNPGLRPQLEVDFTSAATADAGGAHRTAVANALDALARRQLLCAMREGPYGAKAANQVIERLLRRAWDVDDDAEWYAGRAVIITRNDYAAGLFNGDVGLCLADAAGVLRVWFEGSPSTPAEVGDGPQTRTLRSFAVSALPVHETAFAITIHKSQGSEYATAAVLLPAEADNRILSRQLLYTGVSRARRAVELWSSDAALAVALATPVRRRSGLAERLGKESTATRTPALAA